MSRPDILFIMTDQQRFDTIRALGNTHIYTPNLDRLFERGLSFANAYSTCPVCVPARYTIRTGCEPPATRVFKNGKSEPVPGQAETMEGRCGPYLARTMGNLGYRTFGIGKFHTHPRFEDLGYDVHLHSEETYGSPEQRSGDAYASWITENHPEYDFLEILMGERTEMYYMPQMSALPAECTVERWAADRACEQISDDDARPFFGFVSFVGPHPPLAPPVPFNRMYNPDNMPDPVRGNIELDQMDEQIPWMNYLIWAEDINDSHARVLKARYYGEISYIDSCIGRILDEVEKRDDAANTLICFFADHGDHFGDHHAWQKESFFEQSCRIPFLVSWPSQIRERGIREELVCLTDLFGIATGAAGDPDLREGKDLLGMLRGSAQPRTHVTGMYGEPGTFRFKTMVRSGDWKYIYIANGGFEQLFNVREDPFETENRLNSDPGLLKELRQTAVESADREGADEALDGNTLKSFSFRKMERSRIYQFDGSRGVKGFPDRPEDLFNQYPPKE